MSYKIPDPAPDDMLALLNNLQHHHYAALDSLCSRIPEEIETCNAYNDPAMSGYLELAGKFCACVAQYRRMQQLVLTPYLHDLIQKEDDGHDCSDCNNSCSVKHGLHLTNIHAAHMDLQAMIKSIRHVRIVLAAGSIIDEPSRQLRADVAELASLAEEMVFIESTALIPLIKTLQQNIRAHG